MDQDKHSKQKRNIVSFLNNDDETLVGLTNGGKSSDEEEDKAIQLNSINVNKTMGTIKYVLLLNKMNKDDLIKEIISKTISKDINYDNLCNNDQSSTQNNDISGSTLLLETGKRKLDETASTYQQLEIQKRELDRKMFFLKNNITDEPKKKKLKDVTFVKNSSKSICDDYSFLSFSRIKGDISEEKIKDYLRRRWPTYSFKCFKLESKEGTSSFIVRIEKDNETEILNYMWPKGMKVTPYDESL